MADLRAALYHAAPPSAHLLLCFHTCALQLGSVTAWKHCACVTVRCAPPVRASCGSRQQRSSGLRTVPAFLISAVQATPPSEPLGWSMCAVSASEDVCAHMGMHRRHTVYQRLFHGRLEHLPLYNGHMYPHRRLPSCRRSTPLHTDVLGKM